MKVRIISAIVALAITIPLMVKGGLIFDIGIVIISLLGLKEFISSKENEKKLPLFIKVVSYILMMVILVIGLSNKEVLTLNYASLASLFMSFLLPTVLYHNKDRYSIRDAFYMIGGLLFLSISMIMLSSIRSIGLAVLIYLFSITILNDTFALVTGKLIGKTKLLEDISPNKTIEGTLGGLFMGTLLPVYLYVTVIDPNINILLITVITIFLSILGQLGDLVFSAIKRYYGIKDFSNIMPGHGGVLDRLDSIIFVMLGYMMMFTLL